MTGSLPPAEPLLPPYGYLDAKAVQCVAEASRFYDVPELLLHAILQKEGGHVGAQKQNKNGSWDLGLAQINTSWLPLFAPYGVNAQRLRDSACINVYAEAWVLRYSANQVGHNDWFKATMAYNVGSATRAPARLRVGYNYASDVVKRWWRLYEYVSKRPIRPT